MATDVMIAANGRWRDILEVLAGLPSEQLTNRHQPCPACGGRDRYRFDDRDGNGSWFCNQCGGKDHLGGGGTGIDLLMRVRRWSFRQACEEVERYLGLEAQGNGRHRPQPVSSGNGAGGKAPAATGLPGHASRPWRQPEVPPADAAPPELERGAIAQWCYRDASGAPLFWIQRLCPGRSGRKGFLHRVWLDGGWHRPSRRDPFSCEWPAPRPLYGLPGLTQRPDAPVLVVEGEGTADAAALLFPEHEVISWANGTNAIAKADWQPLGGRAVTLWPDADAPGRKAMARLAALLREQGCCVRLVEPPADLPQGWDLADADWSPAEAAKHLQLWLQALPAAEAAAVEASNADEQESASWLPLTRQPINPATARSPENTASQTINRSKGEKLTRKKSRILLIICVSKSAPCNSLEIPAERRRRTQTWGVFPLFPEAAQGASEIFRVLGNPLSPCTSIHRHGQPFLRRTQSVVLHPEQCHHG